MSYKIIDHSKGRIQISPHISIGDLKDIASNNDVSIIQFSEPLSERDIDNLVNYIFLPRPNIALRVYGHYSKGCDLSFLKKLPMLQKLSADCLLNLQNVAHVTTLENLQELHIGGYNLESFDFLNDVSDKLTQLSLEKTFSKKPSLKLISKFTKLEKLYIEGHSNGIEAIGHLKYLKDLTLRSVTVPNLNFLRGLVELWSVDIKLGGIKNFDALSTLPNLKYLELWQINKLSDISFISELKSLQNLFIQSLRNVESMPSFDKNLKLRRIYLENLKGLKDLSSLKTAPSLNDFCYTLAQNQQPENLTPILENNSVKKVFVRFGSNHKNDAFDKMIKESGKELYSYYEFKYE